jgi:hypothetical protein
MRMGLMLAGLAVAGLTATAALAEDGVYTADLTRMVNDAADGTCTAELMAEGLLKACQEQIAVLGPALKELGAAQSVTLTQSETQGGVLVESYAVAYAGGTTLTWVIGARHADGKFGALYVPGEQSAGN